MANRYSPKSQAWRDRKKWADINFTEYVCPIDETFHKVKKSGCSNETIVSTAAGRVAFKPGSFVSLGSHAGGRTEVILGFPPPGRVGSSNFPIQSKESVLDSIGVVSANPDTLPAGSTGNSVTVYGFGFLVGDTWEAVEWDGSAWIVDVLITVVVDTLVSASEIVLTIDVGATGDDYMISLRAYR